MTPRHTSFGQHSQTRLDRLISLFRYRRLIKLIPPASRVLDLGCGYHADFLRSLGSRLKHGTGIDLALARTQSRHLHLLSLPIDQILPLKSASFDVVTALAVLEHVDHPDLMLHEAYRLLRPGGILLLTTPSWYGKPLLEGLSRLGFISRTEILDHKRYYLPSSLYTTLKLAGFSHPRVQLFGPLWLNILGVATK